MRSNKYKLLLRLNLVTMIGKLDVTVTDHMPSKSWKFWPTHHPIKVTSHMAIKGRVGLWAHQKLQWKVRLAAFDLSSFPAPPHILSISQDQLLMNRTLKGFPWNKKAQSPLGWEVLLPSHSRIFSSMFKVFLDRKF